ncbi:MAG: HAMP domain-containing sensor histidine kinase, partial [Thermoanaerobaculia bacterium]|nr:HAMP domain-containing sensor histidine kinase [Thermoanaerobaculia bacterium]
SVDPEIIDPLRRCTRRLKLLTEGLMRLERFRPDEVPVRPRPLDLTEFVEELITDYRYDAESKGLRIETDLEPDLELRADPDLMHDAVANLVENAIKYTDEGFVRIATRHRDSIVMIAVSDSGEGISEKRQEELFDPVIPDKPGGVGLGLNVAIHAARAQSGTIEFESAQGKGSTFTIELPKEVEPREDSKAD